MPAEEVAIGHALAAEVQLEEAHALSRWPTGQEEKLAPLCVFFSASWPPVTKNCRSCYLKTMKMRTLMTKNLSFLFSSEPEQPEGCLQPVLERVRTVIPQAQATLSHQHCCRDPAREAPEPERR
mmetsp:Transcript_52213/g.124469  ORF Transcript_52213/g.124469 Transcript_52213/m.124469 type:complete len:124 (+) Transcript_52213:2061-2432(+)